MYFSKKKKRLATLIDLNITFINIYAIGNICLEIQIASSESDVSYGNMIRLGDSNAKILFI